MNSYGDTMVLLRVTVVTNSIRQVEFTLTIWRLDDDDDDDDLDDLDKKKNKNKQNGGVYEESGLFCTRERKNFTALKCPLQYSLFVLVMLGCT